MVLVRVTLRRLASDTIRRPPYRIPRVRTDLSVDIGGNVAIRYRIDTGRIVCEVKILLSDEERIVIDVARARPSHLYVRIGRKRRPSVDPCFPKGHDP